MGCALVDENAWAPSFYRNCACAHSNGTIMERFIRLKTCFVVIPLSEIRHRLYSHEIPEIIEGLRLRLEGLLEKKTDLERAENAFRTMYRLEGGIVGRRARAPLGR